MLFKKSNRNYYWESFCCWQCCLLFTAHIFTQKNKTEKNYVIGVLFAHTSAVMTIRMAFSQFARSFSPIFDTSPRWGGPCYPIRSDRIDKNIYVGAAILGAKKNETPPTTWRSASNKPTTTHKAVLLTVSAISSWFLSQNYSQSTRY